MDKQDTKDKEFVAAPQYSIPETEFLVIEYPGYVKNNSKAYETLGGLDKISEPLVSLYCSDLELRFVPEDPFCNPLIGVLTNTTNLVLKLSRKVKKYKDGRIEELDPEKKWDIKALGSAKKTFRFRGIADYQYHFEQGDPIVNFINSAKKLDDDNSTSALLDEMINSKGTFPQIPIPFFFKVSQPLHYNYRDHSKVKESFIEKDGELIPHSTVLDLPEDYKNKIIKISFDAIDVPTESLTVYKELKNESAKKVLEIINKKFQDRPIWPRYELVKLLPEYTRKNFVFIRCLFAYYVHSGPWRDLWIRFGYDPRVHQEDYIYQQISTRNMYSEFITRRNKVLSNKGGIRNESSSEDDLAEKVKDIFKLDKTKAIEKQNKSNNLNSQNSIDSEEDVNSSDNDEDKETMNTKDSSSKKTDLSVNDVIDKVYEIYGIHYGNSQLCSIKIPRIQKLISNPSVLQDVCTKESGWLKPQVHTFLRNFVRSKLDSVIQSFPGIEKSQVFGYSSGIDSDINAYIL
ncbi:hypothetical protein BB560_002739 [Smittium megazygosporum]|uniref:Transcription factor IIIC subunit 5 HTH domain-containing protein n=1 Tax=Smittium megazygosporum TaxID=133381 RepID=A0A2T9ZE30_9FUNG|nr:hypothetical protein BB560_002739 [Smittium megazygosporum]